MNCFLGWIITTCFIRINWHVVISQWFSMPEDWKIKQKLISRKLGQNPLFLFQEKEFTACRFSGAGFPLAAMVKQSFSQQRFFPIHLSQRDECIFQQLGITEHQGPGSTTVVLLFFSDSLALIIMNFSIHQAAVLLQLQFCCSLTQLEKAGTSDCCEVWGGFQQTSDKQDAVKGVYGYFNENCWQIQRLF